MNKKIVSSLNSTFQKMIYEVKESTVLNVHKVGKSLWKRIPAIKWFFIIPMGPADAPTSFGIEASNKPVVQIAVNENNKMNRYMKYQLYRMEKMKVSRPRTYWTWVELHIKRSVSFRMSAINHVYKGWWKKYPLGFIFSLNNKVNKLISSGTTDLAFKRVYIPKPNGKLRPLGVPSPEWRVLLHMIANFLELFVRERLKSNQHAYQYAKGTFTAWKELAKKVHKYKYIYEYDLKECFDNISVEQVSSKLESFGMPKAYMYYIENINRCTVKLPSEISMDERVQLDKISTREMLKRLEVPKNSDMFKAWNEMEPENKKVVEEIAIQEGFDNIYEFIMTQWAILDSINPTGMGSEFRGVPQGANTSPICSLIALDDFQSQYDGVHYADDGLFFSNTPITLNDNPHGGIELNREKTRIIKEDGKWLHNLRFLGLEFIYKTGKVRGKTRKGSNLEFGIEQEGFVEYLKLIRTSYSSWIELVFSNKFSSNITSKLYNNSWENLVWDEKYPKCENSWASREKSVDNASSSRANRWLKDRIKAKG